MKVKLRTIILIVFLVLFFTVGFGFGWVREHISNIHVDTGYVGGILTASSILFGFWAVVFERSNQGKDRIQTYEKDVVLPLFISFLLLMFTVVLVFFSALDEVPSVITLFFATASLLFNAFLLADILLRFSNLQVLP